MTLRPAGAGRLVLCTDGLWNHLASTDELAALVADVGRRAPRDRRGPRADTTAWPAAATTT